ncbi:hypothetical protein BaRGS_00012154 [Batillaria attramentaria]|uniref:CWH43-like N-terminal domain-containing protein n=1 Tax=Batillaria attramentaria TaxID=370345 RepID=A0ABD0LAE9_9CAEN
MTSVQKFVGKAGSSTGDKGMVVYNFLPTISAAIGGFTPQRYVWRICIAMHAPQRIMAAVAYYIFHTSVHLSHRNELYRTLAALVSLLHVIEVMSLVGLSMISSTENGKLHEGLFISFMASALFYMLLTIILMRWGRFGKDSHPSHEERTSLQYKTRLFIFNITVFVVAVYFFWRHNKYCEPGVYSYFALGEYLVVLSNIAYQSLAVMDFRKSCIVMFDLGSPNPEDSEPYFHMPYRQKSVGVFGTDYV